MSQNYPSINNALGSVIGATGVAKWIAGAASAKTGVGVYTLTLDEAANEDASAIITTLRGGAAGSATVTHMSDAVKVVNTFNPAGVATDLDFDFLCLRAPQS